MYINSTTSYFDSIKLLGTMKGTMFTSCVVPGEQDRSLSSCATNGCEFHLKVPPNLVPTSHTCVKPATVSFLFAIHLFLQPLTIFL